MLRERFGVWMGIWGYVVFGVVGGFVCDYLGV
jgi:hypothetical protein